MDGLGNGEGVLMEGAGKHIKARLSLSKGVACELFFTLTVQKSHSSQYWFLGLPQGFHWSGM